MSKLEEKKLSGVEYYRNSFLHIHEDDVLLPDGGQSKRIVVTHVGAVNIIALTAEKELLLVRQYRYPLGVETIETPAGKLEADEAPTVTAKRELEEETGYTCEALVQLGTHATAPGFTNEVLHQFLATGVTKLDVAVSGDEDEFTELLTISKDQALRMVKNGEIFDLKTVYAIQYLTLAGLW
ncbi:MAG: NUDIX hydrolase [Defluviitaleaceae bacterium]|nr:NUDIX hydrolase [Defluviitaleaceae bacterium]